MKIVFLIIVVIFVLIFFSFRSNEEIVENLSNVPTDTSPFTNDPVYLWRCRFG
jgi:Cu/Ag efflux pump CusA